MTLLSHTSAPPAGEDAEQLDALGVRVVTEEVASLEISGTAWWGCGSAAARWSHSRHWRSLPG